MNALALRPLDRWVDTVNCIDAETLLRSLPGGSVQLIAIDGPFNVNKAIWDTWPSVAAYLAWLDSHLREFKRVLAPNGSLYLFCATEYAADVEIAVEKRFNVLNNIRWRKPPFSTKAEMFDKETMRAYFPASESIIFAEQQHYSEYELNGQVYAPIKDWFRQRAKAFDITPNQFNAALGFAITGSGMAGTIIGEKAEFLPPTLETYQKMQAAYPQAFNRDYIDLRREYEALKAQYEALRRPFTVSARDPYTDVWDFATVNTYPGKHPCEKPLDMMRHIVRASSRPGDLVLDCFCGSGATLRAAFVEGRHFIGGDSDAYWARRAGQDAMLPYDVPLFEVA